MIYAMEPNKTFTARHPWDSNFFLFYLLVMWAGIVVGFSLNINRHIEFHAPAYPFIVHIHAVVFTSWMILLTTQMFLIRANNVALHKRLGMFGAVLAFVMVFCGTYTALRVADLKFGTPYSNPSFLAIQLTDMLAFAVLMFSAIILRKNSSAHKRLIILATLYISMAGFARWLGESVGLVHMTLVLGMGLYDLLTRRKLLTSYVLAAAWSLTVPIVAHSLLSSPTWLVIATALIGH